MQASGSVRIRFWASARAAAGTGEVTLADAGALTVAELVERLVADDERSRGAPAAADLAKVLGVCSVLVDARPHGPRDRDVPVPAGAEVEFLPPFAGG